MASPNYRIVVPASASGLLKLAEEVYKKHQADAELSPLKTLQSNSWETNGPKVARALLLQADAEKLKRQAEDLYKQRDLLIDEIDDSVKASRDILLGIYRSNPKELGNWGFEVNDSVSKSKGETPGA